MRYEEDEMCGDLFYKAKYRDGEIIYYDTFWRAKHHVESEESQTVLGWTNAEDG